MSREKRKVRMVLEFDSLPDLVLTIETAQVFDARNLVGSVMSFSQLLVGKVPSGGGIVSDSLEERKDGERSHGRKDGD